MRTKRLIRPPKLRNLRNENLNRNPPRKQNPRPQPRNLARKGMQHQSPQRWQRAGGENQRKEKTRTTQSRLQKTRKFLPIIPYSVCIILSLVSFLILNGILDAIMNVASPLQSSAEDFLESLQQSPGAALAELINLILRSCGCNDSVDSDQAVDFDGIVSTLDDFTESLKQVHCSSLFLV